MKSYGGIIEQASSYSKLYESFDYVLRGTMRKTCPTGQKLLAHREEVIAQLQQELREGTFRISHYHQFHIIETVLSGIPVHNGILSSGIVLPQIFRVIREQIKIQSLRRAAPELT